MTEERAHYKVNTPPVKAVRLENFTDDTSWHALVHQRLFHRFPAARVVTRKPQLLVIELRDSRAWSLDDEEFFAVMRQQGFFRRWETLAELPPAPRSTQATYEAIGVRVGEGQPLTREQSAALLSLLHDMEQSADFWEADAKEQRSRADAASEHANRMATDWNALVGVLDQELSLKVSADGESRWMAEDSVTGKVLMRGKTLPEVYQTALALRLQRGGEKK